MIWDMKHYQWVHMFYDLDRNYQCHNVQILGLSPQLSLVAD